MRIAYRAVWLAACCSLGGAELSIPKITLSPGAAVVGGIRYAAQTHELASLQFDLRYDSASLNIVPFAGPAAVAVEKAVAARDVAPGRKRILLMGLNQSTLPDGVVVSLRISTDSLAPGMYELRLTDAVGSDKYGRPVPVATIDGNLSVASAGGMPGRSALGQVASGGPWKTTLTLVNLAAAPATARLNFWAGDGQPLVLPLAFPGAGGVPSGAVSSLDCSLDPGAMFVVETQAPDVAETLVGWTELQSSDNVIGFAVLRSRVGPDRDAEAMLVLEQRRGLAYLLPYDDAGGFRTGIAIANQSPDSPADLTLLLRDEAGGTISTESLALPPRGHASFVASERFPVLLGRRGTIEVRNGSGEPFSVLGLRFNPSGSFTSVPVISR